MPTDRNREKKFFSVKNEQINLSGQVEVSKTKKQLEQTVEQESRGLETKAEEQVEKQQLEQILVSGKSSDPAGANQAQVYYQAQLKAIDDILSAGLQEIYLQLNSEKQKEFKRVGEETVVKIASLLEKTKVRVDKIIELIRNWLKIIPGVNKYFLEQEAKIKADRILRLKNK